MRQNNAIRYGYKVAEPFILILQGVNTIIQSNLEETHQISGGVNEIQKYPGGGWAMSGGRRKYFIPYRLLFRGNFPQFVPLCESATKPG